MRLFGDRLQSGPLLQGFFGFGQSGGEQASTAGINSIFNYALPEAKKNAATGNANLGTAAGYFDSLLHAGRTETAQNAAPAINTTLAQSDAMRRREATAGTGRTGGTAELNREAGATTNATIDNIIANQLGVQRQQGGEGLAQIGRDQTSEAAQLLGLANSGQENLYSGAISKEGGQTAGIAGLIQSLL